MIVGTKIDLYAYPEVTDINTWGVFVTMSPAFRFVGLVIAQVTEGPTGQLTDWPIVGPSVLSVLLSKRLCFGQALEECPKIWRVDILTTFKTY